jgi:probable F420-dependent oxidoreductase
VKIALFASLVGSRVEPELAAALGRGAEERGFDSVWMGEHVVELEHHRDPYPYSSDGELPRMVDGGMAEPLVALSFLAACTRHIRLGTGVLILPQRNPVYLAKEIATLDRLSRGRVDLGVGIGWQREEFAACGAPWEERGRRADEFLDLLRVLWCDSPARFEGRFWRLPECRQLPPPVQRPHPPLHVAGESDAALRRAARRGQGWLGYLAVARAPERIAALEAQLREFGRARAGFEVTIVPLEQPTTLDAVKRLRDAGAQRVAAIAVGLGRAELERQLDALAEQLVEPAHSLS